MQLLLHGGINHEKLGPFLVAIAKIETRNKVRNHSVASPPSLM